MNNNDSTPTVNPNGSVPTIPDCLFQVDTGSEVAFKVIAFSLVLFLALIGNILVVWVVHKSTSMRKKPINLFIVNLAVADLLLAVFVIPRIVTQIVIYSGIWLVHGTAGLALCRIVIFIQDIATAVSLQSLVIIAFDRFCAVVYPLRIATMPCTTRLVVIPMTWIVACALHSPDLFIYKLIPMDNGTVACAQVWSSDKQEHAKIASRYYLAMFCLFVIIPMILLTVLYASIFVHLKRRGKKTDLHTSGVQVGKRKEQEWNVLKMALAIVIGFAVCYGPFNVLIFLRIFKWDIWIPVCRIKTLYFVTTFLVYFNTALNPIIYFTFSENFRLGFKRVFTHSKHSSKVLLTSVNNKMRAEGTHCDSTHQGKTTCHVLDTHL